MALAWCGGRTAVSPLIEVLGDTDWVTRQSAHVSLTNLTAMEFPFDSLATPARRDRQATVWRDWWSAVPPDRPPADVLALLDGPSDVLTDTAITWRHERGFRALGALGGDGAVATVLESLGPAPPTAPTNRRMVRAAIRALGRLRTPRHEEQFDALVRLLDNTMWARCAADALGDLADPRAASYLLAAYPRYAKRLDGTDPLHLPADDKMGFPSEDRMLETPYAIAFALCRLPLDDVRDRAALRQIAPLAMANLPGDHDTFMLYEPEVGHRLTRHLMEASGLRQAACEHAFQTAGAAASGGPFG